MMKLHTVDTDLEMRPWNHSILDAAEQERAASMIRPLARRRWVRSRIALREILAQELACDPKEISLASRNGKPVLRDEAGDPSLQFSLSRSEQYVVVATSANANIGIDIERIRPIQNRDQKIRKFFCDCERNDIFSLPHSVRDKAFLQTWTAKEAWLKAVGTGVTSFPITAVCVSLDTDIQVRHCHGSESTSWQLVAFERETLTGCIAVNNGTATRALKLHG